MITVLEAVHIACILGTLFIALIQRRYYPWQLRAFVTGQCVAFGYYTGMVGTCVVVYGKVKTLM